MLAVLLILQVIGNLAIMLQTSQTSMAEGKFESNYLSGYGIYAMVAGIAIIFGAGIFVVFILAQIFAPMWVSSNSSSTLLADCWWFSVIVEAVGAGFGLVILVLGTPSWFISYKIAVAIKKL